MSIMLNDDEMVMSYDWKANEGIELYYNVDTGEVVAKVIITSAYNAYAHGDSKEFISLEAAKVWCENMIGYD